MPTNTEQLKRAIQLTEQINSLQGELDRLISGLKVGGVSVATSPASTAGKPGRKKGKMSAAGRAAIVAAQKARWAKIKAAKGGKASASPAAKPAKKKRTFSAAARAKMAAAAKARWAKKKGK